MSSRALRKAQKQREEEEALERLKEEAEALEESDEDEVEIKPQRSAFALLNDQEDDDEDAESDDQQEQSRISDDSDAETPAAPVTSKANKKKRKKKKPKTQPVAPEAQSKDLDDIDAALKSLSATSDPKEAATAATMDPDLASACKLLSIDSQNLHAQNEMKRLFGRAAMDSNEQDDQQNAGGRRRNRQQMGGLAAALGRRQGAQGGRASGLGLLGLRRNLFIQGKEEWPIGTSGGLGMEIVEKHSDGIVEYRFVHNTTYQATQADFEVCVRSMDPERMIRLLQLNPYHISTLLQVSEIAKQERDHTTSGDLLERALFSFGRALHSTFSAKLAQGQARMDFRRPENREFWLAASRYMINLGMRATWRTVFEWAKLLLALDPENDPYQICLAIDQYALRARQPKQLLEMATNPILGRQWKTIPGMQLSLGLASVQSGSTRQPLFTAANRRPWSLSSLFTALGLDAPPGIWGTTPSTERDTFYAALYSSRAKDLWASPEAQSLLTEVAAAVVPGAVKAAAPDDEPLGLGEARHVLLLADGDPALLALLPRKITQSISSASDPLPPEDEVWSYTVRGVQPRPPTRGEQRGIAAAAAEELRDIFGRLGRLMPAMRTLLADEERRPVSDEEVETALQGSGMTREEFTATMERFEELMEGEERRAEENEEAEEEENERDEDHEDHEDHEE